MAKFHIQSRVIIHDNNKVIDAIPSAHTPDYTNRPDAIINPDNYDLVNTVPIKYLKVNQNGTDIEEMTEEEKAIVDKEIADKEVAEEELRKDIEQVSKLEKALWLVQLEEFNRIRGWLGKPQITLEQFKQAVKVKYEEL